MGRGGGRGGLAGGQSSPARAHRQCQAATSIPNQFTLELHWNNNSQCRQICREAQVMPGCLVAGRWNAVLHKLQPKLTAIQIVRRSKSNIYSIGAECNALVTL